MVSSPWRCVPPLLVLILCSACPGGNPGGADAGNAAGDYEDEGPFASCRYEGASACGAKEGFSLGGCDTGSLGGVGADGVWTVHSRYTLVDGGSDFTVANLTLHSDGSPEWIDRGYDVTRKDVGGTSFYVGFDLASPDGGTFVRTYVGCSAPSPDVVQGCTVTCRNNQPQYEGTFHAKKVQRRASETEARGLALVSESPARGIPADVYVTKGHAYVVSLDGPTGPGGLTVFDMANPAAPVKKPELTGPAGSFDSYWNAVWAKGDALYVASAKSGVRVYDISDAANPTFVKSVPGGEAINVHTVFVRGDRLYAMAPSSNRIAINQVLIYDVSTPLSPRLLSRYTVPGALTTARAYPHDSFVHEDRLYSFHWSLGLQISNVADPAAPVHLGAYRYERSTSHAGAVARYGDRLIAFEGGEDFGAHLRVLDVTHPEDIVKLGEWRTRPEVSIHNMVLDEASKHLYIAHYQDGVRVLDVSEPSVPVEVAHFNTWDAAQPGRGVDFYDGAIGIRRPTLEDGVEGGLLFVVDTVRGLLVLREQ
ncbi:MAG: hypothetical protein L0Y66_09790 [Myxococcaceae bacterium]|nr:hypothetical protein [Myxococcaceae bacterium]